MSREAMEAVQDHSSINDPMGRHIFVTIGRFVAADTKQGWCSDRTIAELASVDKDTVGAWRGRLEEAGEIETWVTGSGRGAKRYYKFLLPFTEPKHDSIVRDNNEIMSQPERDNNNGTITEILSRMEKLMSRMEEVLSRQEELMSRINVPNVPPRTGQEHHNTIENTIEHQDTLDAVASKGERNQILSELEKKFAIVSGLPVPARKTSSQKAAAGKRWWNPLWEIYELEGNIDAAHSLIEQSVKEMQQNGLTISAPQSILSNALSIYGKKKSGSYVNGSHTPPEPSRSYFGSGGIGVKLQ